MKDNSLNITTLQDMFNQANNIIAGHLSPVQHACTCTNAVWTFMFREGLDKDKKGCGISILAGKKVPNKNGEHVSGPSFQLSISRKLNPAVMDAKLDVHFIIHNMDTHTEHRLYCDKAEKYPFVDILKLDGIDVSDVLTETLQVELDG